MLQLSDLPLCLLEVMARSLLCLDVSGALLGQLASILRAQHAPDIANQPAASWNGNFSIVLLLEQLLVSDDVKSLPPAITSELLRLYEYQVRRRATDAPNTTWELHASGLQDLQPIAASGGSRL